METLLPAEHTNAIWAYGVMCWAILAHRVSFSALSLWFPLSLSLSLRLQLASIAFRGRPDNCAWLFFYVYEL